MIYGHYQKWKTIKQIEKLKHYNQVWQHTLLISVLRRQSQVNLCEFEISLVQSAKFQDSQWDPVSKYVRDNRVTNSMKKEGDLPKLHIHVILLYYWCHILEMLAIKSIKVTLYSTHQTDVIFLLLSHTIVNDSNLTYWKTGHLECL